MNCENYFCREGFKELHGISVSLLPVTYDEFSCMAGVLGMPCRCSISVPMSLGAAKIFINIVPRRIISLWGCGKIVLGQWNGSRWGWHSHLSCVPLGHNGILQENLTRCWACSWTENCVISKRAIFVHKRAWGLVTSTNAKDNLPWCCSCPITTIRSGTVMSIFSE